MWLNKSILFATAILIVSILLFSSQTTATNCKTVTKTRHCTKTINPKNCPKTKTTTVTVINGATDAISCCVACAQDPNCVQWNLASSRCFLSGSATCNNPIIPFGIAATAGGIMRCQDGCLPPN
ncbi:16993_t:CDS:2 [Rhizophagus irregularis]|nr:16993_t:CDS:2 [Rhizophagus irregularis]